MSTTLYVLLTTAILLGAENGDVSRTIKSATKVFKEYLFGYVLPLIFIACSQWLFARLKTSKVDQMGDDRRRLVRLLERAYGLTLSTVYLVDETTAEIQGGVLCVKELIMEVRIFGCVVWCWEE